MTTALRTCIYILFFLLTLVNFPAISGYSQTPLDIISPQELDSKAEVIKIKQDGQASLSGDITELEKENTRLTKQIGDIQAQIAVIDSDINKNLTTIQTLESSPTNGENISPKILDLEKKNSEFVEQKNKKISEIQEKEATIDANKTAIEELTNKIKSNQTEISSAVNSFQVSILSFIVSISRYVALIVMYWVAVQLIRILMRRYLPNEIIRNIIALILVFLAIIATFVTIFIAFAGNTTYLGPSLGVFSAALVVALQDFISSFFAWVVIKARGPFKVNDIIEIPTSNGLMKGLVVHIGFFRTRIKEQYGGDSPGAEQFTGENIFFPNNVILKQGFRNSTFDNKILWHSIPVTITFESNVELAKQIIEDAAQKEFEYMLDHKDLYLDDVYNIKTLYKPRVNMIIGDHGPKFTMWISCRVGVFREVTEKISLRLLRDFKHHGIELAYPTTRVYRSDNLPATTSDFNPFLGA